jgi:valyl-tRNA synthetase
MIKLIPQIEEIRWKPRHESKILKKWKREKVYEFNLKKAKNIFSIDTPPPYPSGWPWHIGAVAHYSQIDMVARAARMLGFDAFFPIGIDRNGIPVERYVESKLGKKMHEIDRKKFIKQCKKILDELEKKFIQLMKEIGISGDFKNIYKTDSRDYRKITQLTFIELWKNGLIYSSLRPNNYCFDCKTTLADADIAYKEIPTNLVYIKFKVKELGKDIIVATTRPELLCSCQAVLFNPKDERYKNLENLHAIVPIYEREVPIIPHPSVKPEFGSGLVMVCSYGDYTDVRLFRELGLKEIIAINLQGKMTEKAGKYAGLTVKEAKKKIVTDLERMKLVAKKKKIMHRVPMCERSNEPIEIIPMEELYLKQLEFRERIKKIAEKITFLPETHKQFLFDWIDGLTIDWPISRRRYYGTEIPIWYCKNCGEPHLPKPGKYYKPWGQKPPFKKCKKCGSKRFVGEKRVFDTWFDSSISPLFISNFFDKRKSKKLYPVTLRPQGRDIIRTWLYYTLLRCYQLTKKPCFKFAWIGGMGLDEKGEKMSKSKGNIIDPVPLLKKYGADAFRFWNANEASHGSDFRCSEQRVENASKFLTKFWNVARFISQFPVPKKVKLSYTDKWILEEIEKLTRECLEGYKKFNFFIPAVKIREFIWNIFAPHYIEMIKSRVYKFDKTSKSTWYALHYSLKRMLILLAPITPFITDYIWRKLYGKKSIHFEKFPRVKKINKRFVNLTPKLIEFNSEVWSKKKKKNLPLTAEIKIKIPRELYGFKEDLITMHNIVR